jgi:hypothetical protein
LKGKTARIGYPRGIGYRELNFIEHLISSESADEAEGGKVERLS